MTYIKYLPEEAIVCISRGLCATVVNEKLRDKLRAPNQFENPTKSSLVTKEIIIVPQIKSESTKSNTSEKSHHIKVMVQLVI